MLLLNIEKFLQIKENKFNMYLDIPNEFSKINHIFSSCNLSLGDKQKMYEKILDLRYDSSCHIIIRLDGKNFSHRVKQWKLKKPFDERFNKCMIKTCEILFNELQNVKWIWTGSDEISIILNNEFVDGLFSRRISKVLSISSSIATYAFNFAALKEGIDVENYPAFFDSRLTVLPNEREVFCNILFRQNDCIRNSISQYSRAFYSAKELTSKGRDEQLKMLLDKNFDWNKDAPNWSKYGVKLFKVYDLYDLNTKTLKYTSNDPIETFDEKIEYVRTRISTESKRFE